MSWIGKFGKQTTTVFTNKERDGFLGNNYDYSPGDMHENTAGGATSELILNWAKSLPKSENGILDLAAGQGIESALLANNGYRVTAYDRSIQMSKNAYFGVHIADITKLHPKNNSYSGVLIKDALIFIPSPDLPDMFRNLKAGLIRGGSIMIISQTATSRAHLIPHDSNLPISVPKNDFDSIVAWLKKVRDEVKSGGQIISIEFESNPQEISKTAKAAGFSSEVSSYSRNSPLARENRWIATDGFVAILKKS